MGDLAIIVPSRRRPDNAWRLLKQVQQTTSEQDDVRVFFAVDQDDETFHLYPRHHKVRVEGGNMVSALNEMALVLKDYYPYLAFLGDDTLPLKDWYSEIMNELEKVPNSIVYPNDTINGERLPTGCFMDSSIVETLGFMAPPSLKHLYVDNFWLNLGTALETITYLPETIVQHLHPHAATAVVDQVYLDVYADARYQADCAAFNKYLQTQFLEDVEKFK